MSFPFYYRLEGNDKEVCQENAVYYNRLLALSLADIDTAYFLLDLVLVELKLPNYSYGNCEYIVLLNCRKLETLIYLTNF